MGFTRDRIALLAQSYIGHVGVFRKKYLQKPDVDKTKSEQVKKAALDAWADRVADAGSDDDDDIYALDTLRGADLLIRIIKETAPKLILKWGPEHERALRAGQWLLKKPGPNGKVGTYNENDPKIDWCGVFAAWIWRQAGLNVQWGGGDINNDDTIFEKGDKDNFLKIGYIQKGDICVMNNRGLHNRHYYIVVNADSPTLATVEGNLSLPPQSIGHRHRDRSLIVDHFRLKVD